MISKASTELSLEMQKIGEAMMKAQQESGSKEEAPKDDGAGAPEEKIHDADFKEDDTGTEDKTS